MFSVCLKRGYSLCHYYFILFSHTPPSLPFHFDLVAEGAAAFVDSLSRHEGTGNRLSGSNTHQLGIPRENATHLLPYLH